MAFHSQLVLATLASHPNVAQLYGAVLDPLKVANYGKLVMPRYNCGNILEFVARFNEEPEAMAAMGGLPGVQWQVIKQLAAGLEFLHAAGVLHRNLKPQNVLVHAPSPAHPIGFEVRVADFGPFRSSALPALEAFVAPETREVDEFSPQSDVFSAGLVVWALASGGGAASSQAGMPHSLSGSSSF